MSNKMINDWAPETTSFLVALQAAGFVLVGCDNGEEEHAHTYTPSEPLDPLIAELTACDEAQLFVTHPDEKNKLWFYLVYGNSPGELVSDYSIPSNGQLEQLLEALVASHGEKWEGRAQPRKVSPY